MLVGTERSILLYYIKPYVLAYNNIFIIVPLFYNY